ncbi:AAA family ATPase [Vibrio diazotrophicus]|uniref:AAA family ATPase n=1 Tax=Vibrio diazotrophicus TaxID=685 RepID=UPI000C9DC863|nr:DUF3696 domain-containing protein [Vibrio diazotrophicus]PNH95349.1 DUF3696 domain-containing protein [Vibrio diazotrophicus]
MIDLIKLSGFKKFNTESLPLRPLTLLAGLNGAGKSSLIQGILLAKEASGGYSFIPLNTPFGVDLGTVEDVLNWNYPSDNIEIGAQIRNGEYCEWKLTSPEPTSLYFNVEQVKGQNQYTDLYANPRCFNYLCAERIGPRKTYKLSHLPISQIGVGICGEFTSQIIEAQGNAQMDHLERIHPETPLSEAKFLTYQLERWMSDIVRPLKIRAIKVGSSDFSTLEFKVGTGEWVHSTNMGFGVTYALPIILAGLLTPRDGMLIVENPEAHLHPAGQSSMGIFLAWLAGMGVQVIVETHSDHILNGIRRAIAERKFIPASDANVLFFEDEITKEFFQNLSFTPEGGISNWPAAFFDQYQIDTAALGRARRRAKG